MAYVHGTSRTGYALLIWSILFSFLIPTTVLAFSPNPTLSGIPANTALSLGEYKPAGLPGCHLWGDPNPTVYDGSGVVGYSRFTYDSIHNQMLLWGGGHSTTPRTDVDVLDLNQASLKWQSAYPSTPIADMRLSNYNIATGGWISTGHPAAVHSYDQLTFVPSTGELLYLQNRSSPKSPCINEDELRVQPYITRGPIWSYNTNTKIWTPIEVTPGGEWSTFTYVATEYDPVSGKVIILGGDGMSVYDPVTRVTSRFEGIRGGNYAQNLVYFPPTDKMYYVMSNGTVYELTLNRGDFAKSTSIKMAGVTGTLPPRLLNGNTDEGETGWAYDSVNQIIGGGILNGVFYAFDPVTKVWSSSVMQKSPADLSYNIGSLSVTHVLDYDPVNNVFIFITSGGNYKRYTWAYRYGTGNSTPPPPSPTDTQAPSVPTGLFASSVSQTSATLSWNASTDNVAVTGYRVYRNGSQVGTVSGVSYTDTALTASTAYTYAVTAYDAAGNVSAQSSGVSVTTQSAPASVPPPAATGNCGLITANSTATTVLPGPTNVAKPALGVTYNDPVFGSCVTRVINGSRHTYSQLQAWNADQSLILLNSNRIMDAQTFQTVHILQFNWPASGSAPVWSPTDPNVLYYIGSIQSNAADKDGFNCPNHDRLIKYTLRRNGDTTTGTREMLQCFSEYASIDYHAGWQELSSDGRYLGMVGVLPSGGGKQVFAYDVIDRQKGVVMDIATTTSSSAKVSLDWVAVSPSGKYMLVQYASNGYWRYAGMESFDRATGKYIGKVSATTGHGDLVRDTDGAEYLMQTNASNAYFLGDKHYLIKAKIPVGIILKSDGTIDINATRNTGATTPLMDIGWTNGIHISCRDIQHRGYCVVNTDGNPADKPLQPFEHEVIKLYLDSTLAVPHFERLAHTVTDEPYVAKTPEATCPMIPYWAQSHALLSPDGSKVIFASTWGENCTADSYILTWGGQANTYTTPPVTQAPVQTPMPPVSFIRDIALSGADFSYVTNCSSLFAGGSCTTAITFTPTAAVSRSGTFSFFDAAANVTRSIPLTGLGVAPVVTPPVTPPAVTEPTAPTENITPPPAQTPPPSSPPSSSLTSGLVGYWSFDNKDTNWSTNTTSDLSGNGNTGTITNMTSANSVAGKIGQGLRFEGTNRVIVNDSASLDVTGTITLSAWIYKTAHPAAGNFHTIVSKGTNSSAESNYELMTYGISNTEKLVFYYSNQGGKSIRGNTPLNLNTWYHVVAVYNDTANTINLYVNGVLETGTISSGNPETNSIVANNQKLSLGARDGSQNMVSGGTLDDLRIYNRALSTSEVTDLYNLGATQGLAPTAPKPLAAVATAPTGWFSSFLLTLQESAARFFRSVALFFSRTPQPAAVILSQYSIDFGSVTVGQSATRSVTLTAEGAAVSATPPPVTTRTSPDSSTPPPVPLSSDTAPASAPLSSNTALVPASATEETSRAERRFSSTAHPFSRPLYYGLKGTDVSKLQEHLVSQKLLPADSVTGFYGNLTRLAVEKLQCTRNIVCGGDAISTGYGVVGPKTVQVITGQQISLASSAPASPSTPASKTASLSYGSRGTRVTLLQQKLSALGYLAVRNITGFYGPLTQDAVGRFQCAKAIVCTGAPLSTGYKNAGPKTQKALGM